MNPETHAKIEQICNDIADVLNELPAGDNDDVIFAISRIHRTLNSPRTRGEYLITRIFCQFKEECGSLSDDECLALARRVEDVVYTTDDARFSVYDYADAAVSYKNFNELLNMNDDDFAKTLIEAAEKQHEIFNNTDF